MKLSPFVPRLGEEESETRKGPDPLSATGGILQHMRAQGSITPIEALLEYGCFRLSSVIHKLRHNYGIGIKTDIVEVESGKRYASYSLEGRA